jgi:hypothetical protein
MAKRFIDGDRLIEHLEDNVRECGNPDVATEPITYGCSLGLKCALRYARTSPTVDVAEVRHGHWIHKVKRYPYQPDDCEAVCSVCGMDYALDPEYTIKYFAMHNKFCPNCGARMDGDLDDL